MNSDILSILQNIGVDRLVRALALLVICLLAMRWVLRLSKKMLSQIPNLEPNMGFMLQRALESILLFLTLMVVISTAGIPVTSFVALFSVIGVAVSLAAQGVLSNALGGLLILFSHPFRIGDYVSFDSVEGTVEEIGFLYTKLLTEEERSVYVPNSLANSSTLTNYDLGKKRLVIISVSASYGNTPDEVRAALLDAASGFKKEILPHPAPVVYLTGYGDSNINYELRAFVKADAYWETYYAMNEAVYTAFAKHNVQMNYPQRVVEIKKS